MEAVLNLYSQPEDAAVVRLCMDERPCQWLSEVKEALPVRSGVSRRVDNEYKREGTCVVLLAYDLDKGIRYAQVREQRTKKDYAEFISQLIAGHYAGSQKIKLVQDNLNTHCKGAFYEHLPLARAAELNSRLDFVFTPKHGSWLNMAEIEFSALSRQCLDRRISSIEEIRQTVQVWVTQRNQEKIKIHWSFTAEHARTKMASQYHKVNPQN